MSRSENFDPGRIKSAEKQIFGIRVSLPEADTFASILGEDWQTVRWFATKKEREHALKEMSRRHEFSRVGDVPTLCYELIEQRPASTPQLGKSD